MNLKFTIPVVLLLVANSGLSSPASTTTGRIAGTVATHLGRADESVLANADVTVYGRTVTLRTTTAPDGTYAVDVPPGRYSVTVASPGFCEVTRARFDVATASTVTINVALYVCALANVLTRDGSGAYVGEQCVYVDPLRTDCIPVGSLDVVVRYATREATRRNVTFGAATGGATQPLPVVATFGAWTVYADTVAYDRHRRLLVGRGQVLIDADGKRNTASAVTIGLGSGAPIVLAQE